MIVIADDFTGAAEIAGICLNYNLSSAVCRKEYFPENVDVVILSTDTRSMSRSEALAVTDRICSGLAQQPQRRIFKKTDSVLRGYVLDELLMQMRLLGFNKALLLPANPSLDRKIREGIYYVNGQKISETAFAADPEFPVKSSFVSEMLGTAELRFLEKEEPIPMGISAANIDSITDLDYWATQADNSCLLAGGGDFFEAVLQQRATREKRPRVPDLRFPYLHVCGTAFLQRRNWVLNQGYPYTALIQPEWFGQEPQSQWLDQVAGILDQHQRLIIAFDEKFTTADYSALDLRKQMSSWAAKVVSDFKIEELLIEGGATASTVFNSLGLTSFQPVHVWQRGVVRMKAGQYFVTVKPGSYQMPPEINSLYQ